ncbi:MAG: oxaloacetate-decarboxylating malate dehydrogenase [Elusimicrobia bacterium]|nr:oxaloacetate-decarboxylating malate dehydrogenase [Elusimicrobiota bacterium]
MKDSKGENYLLCELSGEQLVRHPIFNKGTAFTESERDKFGLRGLIPPRVMNIEQQVARILENYARQPNDLSRYLYLMDVMDRNETLFYRVLSDHFEQMLPIVYTPTVGLACRKFGHIYRRARGIYLTPHDLGRVGRVLSNWPLRDVRVVVVTDGERILGLGDLGANGMGIPIGKLALYVAAGGIHPTQILPVCLDVGTDNPDLRGDSLYLGLPQPRERGQTYDALVEEFVEATREVFPSALIQFEDFADENSFRLLQRYQERVVCFNDDIQGTAAVALAVVLASERLTGRSLKDERFVVAGAGSAGAGISDLVVAAQMDAGLSKREATANLWLVDSRGLITQDRDPDTLAPHKRQFARVAPQMSLEAVVRSVRPTVLIGASGQAGLFTGAILENLAERPVVLSLSNPTDRSECTPDAIRRATQGRALIATGSPFPGTCQCNNVYIFPGVGLGIASTGAKRVTQQVFLEAAETLAGLTKIEDLNRGILLPPISGIRKISLELARAASRQVGGSGNVEQWEPAYLPYRRAAA